MCVGLWDMSKVEYTSIIDGLDQNSQNIPLTIRRQSKIHGSFSFSRTLVEFVRDPLEELASEAANSISRSAETRISR